MAEGAGRYDDLCVEVMRITNADCAIVLVVNGNHGNGCSVNFLDHDVIFRLPAILEEIASQIRQNVLKKKAN